jgi:hypothetical protein
MKVLIFLFVLFVVVVMFVAGAFMVDFIRRRCEKCSYWFETPHEYYGKNAGFCKRVYLKSTVTHCSDRCRFFEKERV